MNIFLLLLTSLFLITEVSGDLAANFPNKVYLTKNGSNYQLQLTGAATRKKFFINIYNVASYLEEGAAKGNLLSEIMKDENAKQLIVKWTYNADLGRVRNGYLDSFKSALSEKEYEELKDDIAKYLSFFRKDIRKGDEHILRWLPGGYVESIINGKIAGSITNLNFAKALWSIWFSGDSAANGGSLLTLGSKG